MAPVETDSDNRTSGRKNLCIVFLHSNRREFQSLIAQGINPGPTVQIANAANCSNEQTEALANAAKFAAPPSRIAGLARKLNDLYNNLISKSYF
jgi:hypothetical protein